MDEDQVCLLLCCNTSVFKLVIRTRTTIVYHMAIVKLQGISLPVNAHAKGALRKCLGRNSKLLPIGFASHLD